jgi:hypothetical protein
MFVTLKKIISGESKVVIETRRALYLKERNDKISELERTLWSHIREQWVVPKNEDNSIESYYAAKELWMNDERAICHPFPLMAGAPHDIRWLPQALTPEVLEILANHGFISRR